MSWSHRRLLGPNAPLPLLTGANKTILEKILSSVSAGNSYQPDTEDKKFQQISDLFGLGVRQFPASFEMLALDGYVELEEEATEEDAELMLTIDIDAEFEEETRRNDDTKLVPTTSKCYGFLIESPEPIYWNRTVLMAKYKASSTTTAGIPLAQESTEAIMILGASIVSLVSSTDGGPGPSYNDEMVDILLREDFDISDFSIEHMSAESNNSQKFMAFGTESKRFPAGTIIRVHTGRKQDDTDPSAEVEHRYAELNSWQFSPAGETIKVLDKKGNVLHSRYIVPQGSFSSKDIILIRNADNTRAFIFFPSSGEKAGKIDNGNYLLNFKYKLNIGNNRPILKRMGGIDSDEDTTIEFSYPAILP